MLNRPLPPGADLRARAHRRETFLRFYDFHLRHRAHPGGVYHLLPALADAHGWDAEQRAWCAFLNGNTQNPVTTSLLMAAGNRPSRAAEVIAYWRRNYSMLNWDTDRRYHKARLADAVTGYCALTADGQAAYWAAAGRGGWTSCWAAARAVPTMGRLSAWSYLEYIRLLKVADVPDADTLMLADRAGSRSHRNGLCLVLGWDDLVWWDYNPDFEGRYEPDMVEELERQGDDLLAEAGARIGHPDVSRLTLESALCTYKSWHRPNRRYPNVYNDLAYGRLVHAEARFGHRFDVLWQARSDALPDALCLERNPTDPGAVPLKQNWYRETGTVPVIGLDYPDMITDFDRGVLAGAYGRREFR